jgi:nitrate reductase gamma subunit
MGTILVLAAYLVYLIFCFRFFLRALLWYRAAKQETAIGGAQRTSFRTVVSTLIDVFFFTRLFHTNKLLWAASWTFHLSLVFIFLRHAWYFMNPVPDFIIFIQPAGIAAGYVLPISLLLILIIRITGSRDRYVSVYNYFLVGVLLVISLLGLAMRNWFQPNLIAVKDFITGILMFHPDVLPDSSLFMLHFVFALILLPYVPFHLFTAPVVTFDANRREESLGMILHEK